MHFCVFYLCSPRKGLPGQKSPSHVICPKSVCLEEGQKGKGGEAISKQVKRLAPGVGPVPGPSLEVDQPAAVLGQPGAFMINRSPPSPP